MDSELGTLAAEAATTLVQLLATDGWAKAKGAVERLWRQLRPERAERMTAAVEDSREDLLAALERDGSAAGQELVARELAVQWGAQLRGLLAVGPEAGVLLHELLEQELRPALIAAGGPWTTTTTTAIRADARDHSQSFAAGGNIYFRGPAGP